MTFQLKCCLALLQWLSKKDDALTNLHVICYKLQVWDTSSNYKCVKTLGGHSGIVLALTVFGSRLYSGSQDTKILVWNIDADFELEDTLDAHDNPVCTLAASRGMLFSGSLKTVKVSLGNGCNRKLSWLKRRFAIKITGWLLASDGVVFSHRLLASLSVQLATEAFNHSGKIMGGPNQ